MLNFRYKLIVVTATVMILSGLFVMAGCQNDGQDTPVYVPIESLPLEITIDQLYADYMADEAAADDKYKGERLLFYGIKVDEVRTIIGPEGLVRYNEHIIASGVQFIPRYTSDLDNVGAGFVLDIVGECRGLIWPISSSESLLLISECWVNTIEGGILEEWYPDY